MTYTYLLKKIINQPKYKHFITTWINIIEEVTYNCGDKYNYHSIKNSFEPSQLIIPSLFLPLFTILICENNMLIICNIVLYNMV